MPGRLCGFVGGGRDAPKEKPFKKNTSKKAVQYGKAHIHFFDNGRNTINTPTLSRRRQKKSLGSVVYPSTLLRAIILAEVLAASATLSAGQGCEGNKTPSARKVATAHTKAQGTQ